MLKIFLVTLLQISFACQSQNYVEETKKILGFWVLEKDTSSKVEFLANGEMRSYESDKLVSIDRYSISSSCERASSTLPNEKYLRIVFEDGDVFCYYINGINGNNSGILSLMTTTNGRIVIYKRMK